MKAITLWQPWASLIALGVKTIETRPWATSYRGPLAIHAAVRRPTYATVGDWICDPRYQTGGSYGPIEPRIWRATTQPGDLFASHESRPLPLGAIVATCTLVDVVPMRTNGDPASGPSLVLDCPHEGDLPHQQGGLWLIGPNELTRGTPTRVEDQRPYGDFAPDRFAWLLDDVRPTTERCPACWGKGWHAAGRYGPGSTSAPVGCQVCATEPERACPPVPAKGLQKLWTWAEA